jgi:hypothetical protein
MKTSIYYFTSTLLFLFAITNTAFAQDKTISAAKIAFQNTNIQSLSTYLHSEVAFVVNDEQIASGKTATESSLKSFFSKYSVTHFDFIHQGNSKDGKVFAVGKYDYQGGCYRIRINLKNYGGEYLIDNIDATKE